MASLVLFATCAGCGGGGPTGGGSQPSPLEFIDRAEDAGIGFTAVCGGAEKDWILEVNGTGCAIFDADGDERPDVFFVNGARFEDDPAAKGDPPSDALYRNLGGWRFEDATAASGIRENAWGNGCAVADVENDGDLDLFVTNYGPDELWLNDGRGRFRAAGAEAGVADPGWGSSCVFFDYDRDGLVDLLVVRYLDFDRRTIARRGEGDCEYKGQPILCGPVGLPEAPSALYRNLGGARFEDVSVRSGIASRTGYGLGVSIGDYDADGWLDVYIAADTTENLLFHNRGDGTFEEVGLRAGVARNHLAVAQAGMGVEFTFARTAAIEDLFVVNYEDDTNTYYQNDGDGFFTETTSELGLAAPCFQYLGWGLVFADFDLDADLDLFVAQGHVVPQVDLVPSSPGYRQPNKLFLREGGRYEDRSARSGPGLGIVKSSRGAAAGDLDGDGDVDLVVCEMAERATVLENRGAPRGAWIGVRLVGTRSNRAGIGAVVRVRSGDVVQARRIQSASGYASSSELVARFGLGTRECVEAIDVTWPTGEVERFGAVDANRVVTLREGEGAAP